jgi:hypothetical protein
MKMRIQMTLIWAVVVWSGFCLPLWLEGRLSAAFGFAVGALSLVGGFAFACLWHWLWNKLHQTNY